MGGGSARKAVVISRMIVNPLDMPWMVRSGYSHKRLLLKGMSTVDRHARKIAKNVNLRSDTVTAHQAPTAMPNTCPE